MRSHVGFHLLLCSIVAASTLEISDPSCQHRIEEWLWKLEPVLNVDNATLSVDWEALEESLESHCRYDHLRLELWRSKDKDRTEWSQRIAHEFNGCASLDGDFFWHATREHHGGGDRFSQFPHVVEEEYLFRLCPCDYQSHDKSSSKCKCGSNRYFCGNLLRFPQNSAAAAERNFCKEGSGSYPSQATLLAPVMTANCESITLSGVLASCTPVQDYDRVRISLYPVSPEEELCQFDLHHDSDKAMERETRLVPVNRTHGSFSLTLKQLGETYCLRLELVEHPYCQANIVINDPKPRNMPSICSTVLSQPLRTKSDQVCMENRSPIVSSSEDWIAPMLMFVMTSVVILIILVYCLVRNRVQERTDSNELIHEDTTKPTMGEEGYCRCCEEKSPTPGEIYLLYFPESEDFMDLNLQFREWLEALGAKVYDLSDEKHSETILSEQERWSQSKIGDPKSRIMLVNSPLSAAAATAASLSSENIPLLEGDNLADLRLNALRQVQALYIGDYKRLCVITFDQLGTNSNNALMDLTAMKQLVLPTHLEEVRCWVTGACQQQVVEEKQNSAFRMAIMQFQSLQSLA